ncbi:hypothetical protein G5B00_12775 [Parapedobacter sp. SGR-10]|uniref:hypothetical protein n=1 Tax=Parapedobacter sp. SGR-10 TaxID=2710879 RepID=UPI0013D5C783|nr:hypothetical protein [Parapedobacter sp. SGR-10]NGF57385.1 hypothetical protein [Parapedobacter sp. SGR-10]
MKKQIIYLSLLCMAVFAFSGCATNYKAQVNALAKCNYTVESLDQVKVAGRNIESFGSTEGVSLASLPAIAFALLQQDLPLEANVNLKVANPTSTKTSINEFKYIIEIQGKPLFEGAVHENIHLATNESIVVPLSFRANIFGVAQEKGFDKLLNDILTRKSDAFLALKIKPSVKIGGKNYYYPGYITVDKDLGKSIGRELEKRM